MKSLDQPNNDKYPTNSLNELIEKNNDDIFDNFIKDTLIKSTYEYYTISFNELHITFYDWFKQNCTNIIDSSLDRRSTDAVIRPTGSTDAVTRPTGSTDAVTRPTGSTSPNKEQLDKYLFKNYKKFIVYNRYLCGYELKNDSDILITTDLSLDHRSTYESVRPIGSTIDMYKENNLEYTDKTDGSYYSYQIKFNDLFTNYSTWIKQNYNGKLINRKIFREYLIYSERTFNRNSNILYCYKFKTSNNEIAKSTESKDEIARPIVSTYESIKSTESTDISLDLKSTITIKDITELVTKLISENKTTGNTFNFNFYGIKPE